MAKKTPNKKTPKSTKVTRKKAPAKVKRAAKPKSALAKGKPKKVTTTKRPAKEAKATAKPKVKVPSKPTKPTKATKGDVGSVHHPAFGSLALGADGELTWSKKGSLGGSDIMIDLALPAKRAAAAGTLLSNVAPFVERLAEFDQVARAGLRKSAADQGDDSEVELYRDHHLAQLNPALISKVFRVRRELVNLEKFMDAIRLARVGLYPDQKACAVFDYTLGREITNYLLVVSFDAKGKVVSVAMES